ncbi:glycosyltransferase family 2 protein [Amnibacterium sp. CER49]|uniref:glycosyltransferase family 2 protein n=1 Tax=Amnibacterium sp. CER49 TaxID=3039161 RepID=UPI002446FA1D|nr:glycosyltransferase family 2 protein [Amnibacterium sp. CER49]MDH2442974.1 glycosyltransferase family 2 protein [Amnibacterium sp. CER49]
MPTSVTAILVAADGAEYLRDTLDAITLQTRLPDRFVVVQLGSSPVTTSIIAAIEPTVHAHVGPRAGFGLAVARGVRAAGLEAGDDQWLWLLASDNAPAPDALERLLQAVELAPSVAIAGPKQMQWDAPDYLHSYGETMTPWGTAVELAEPELDQAQYDRQSDVLAVAAGGMLVKEPVWRELGGFDPSLPALDDALDLCVRARLAGHRVQLVPAARVLSAGIDAPGTRLLGASTTEPRRVRLRREAQLHRRLVYAPLPAVPLHWLTILPLGVARAIGQLLRKEPGSAPAELMAALLVFATCFPGVIRARGRIARTRSTGWSSIAPLRQPWREVRRRRGLLRENGRARRREPVRFLAGGGLALTLAVAAISVALHLPLLGAPALAGGGLLPLGDLGSLWGSIGWGGHPLGQGFSGPADPFALVLAVLGTLTFWHPSTAVVLVWFLALPVAAAGGWLAATRFTRRRSLRIVGGLLWAAAPTFLAAMDAGRLPAVLVHLVAPFALLAAFSVRRSWSASATLALLGALLAACSPSLLPVLAGCWIAALVVAALRPTPDARSRLARVIPLPLPTVVLILPLIAEQLKHGSLLGVLADPGPVPAASPRAHLLGLPDGLATVLQLIAGWPVWLESAWRSLALPLGLGASASALLVLALSVPLLVLAAVGIVWPRRSMPIRVGIAGVGGLIAAALATRLDVVADGATPVAAWAGAGLSIAWLGVLEAAVCGLDRLAAAGALPGGARTARAMSRLRTLGTAIVGLTAVAAVLVAGSPLLLAQVLGAASVQASGQATVPAIVAAEAADRPGLGLLTLTPQPDGGVREQLSRGAGRTLEQLSTLATTADFGEGSTLASLSAALVQPTGDDLRPPLDALEIGYVLLTPGAADPGSRQAALDAGAALGSDPLFSAVSTSSAGTLYRYVDLPEAAGRTLDAAAPRNTATPLGLLVLVVQGSVLGLMLLLALPTGRLAGRVRPAPPLRAPVADVANTHAAAAHRPVTPEQAMARELLGPAQAAEPEDVREEVAAWQ